MIVKEKKVRDERVEKKQVITKKKTRGAFATTPNILQEANIH